MNRQHVKIEISLVKHVFSCGFCSSETKFELICLSKGKGQFERYHDGRHARRQMRDY